MLVTKFLNATRGLAGATRPDRRASSLLEDTDRALIHESFTVLLHPRNRADSPAPSARHASIRATTLLEWRQA